MTLDRKNSREENIQELMNAGGDVLTEVKEVREKAEVIRTVLMNPDFKNEDLDWKQKKFIKNELEKLSQALHREDHPNTRLNQVLESEDLDQMIQFARDYLVSRVEDLDNDNVVPIEKIA